MNQADIYNIINWLGAHPDHFFNSQIDTDTPAQSWFRYCINPNRVNPYEDADSCTMLYPKVNGGCEYVFTVGPGKDTRCDVQKMPGKKACEFHNHVIFTYRVRKVLKEQHDDYNANWDI